MNRRFWLAAAIAGGLAGAAGYGLRERLDGGGFNPAAVDALVASPLPDLAGEKRTLAGWRGRVLVVNFWATWCAPCRKEIPDLMRLQARYAGQGVQFVGIAIDQQDKVREFARELGINYPLLMGGLDTMALVREAGNRGGVLPFTLVFDRTGAVSARHAGELQEAQLEAIIKPLL